MTVGEGRPVVEDEVVAADEDPASVVHETGIKNAATSAASQ